LTGFTGWSIITASRQLNQEMGASVDALARFEETLEDALETSFARAMRGRLQPVEIAKRLARAMDRDRTVGLGEVWAPNQYEVRVSPRDYAGLESYRQVLERRLAEYLAGHARERELTLLDAPSVILVADVAVPDGRPQISAELADLPKDKQASTAAELTAGFTTKVPIRPAFAGAGCTFSSHPDGRVYPLRRSPTTLGRSSDNDIILDDRRVSRHHAHLVAEGELLVLRDLQSANGTWVNGRRITEQQLQTGDLVSLGGVELVFRRGRR
jgi:pSer/pThr/pTyr-binding forkhead associated (FHA) protein